MNGYIREDGWAPKVAALAEVCRCALLVLIALGGAIYCFLFLRVVPPISAKVVDALTGEVVSGVNVCLDVSVTAWGRQVLRQEPSTSNASGRAFFWPSIHDLPILQPWQGYGIQVTDPQTEFSPACAPTLGWNFTDRNPWPLYLGETENGRPKYFPVRLVKDGDAEMRFSDWLAMRRTLGFPLNLRIRLIPVLKNIEDCKRIEDPSLAEDCRQLNTYAAAMSLRENQDGESQRRAHELCQEVDQLRLSTECQGRLSGFAMLREAKHFRGDYSRASDVPGRRIEDLFPDKVAGVPRTSASMYDDGSLGTGRRAYSAGYSQQGNAPVQISTQIEEFPNAHWAEGRLDELPGGFADHAPGTVKEEEIRPGQKIERHRGRKYSGAFWISENRVILITFYQPFAKEEEFIAPFLAHFPSTL